MMKTFNIYLKDGQIISAEFSLFITRIKEKQFTIHDSENDEAQDAFISFDAVSAIAPAEQKNRENDTRFLVYLKNHKNPVEIIAQTFKIIPNESVDFGRYFFGGHQLLTDIYIAADEVTAIFPADGLDRRKGISERE